MIVLSARRRAHSDVIVAGFLRVHLAISDVGRVSTRRGTTLSNGHDIKIPNSLIETVIDSADGYTAAQRLLGRDSTKSFTVAAPSIKS